MGDYKLTAGQQQQLTNFLNSGRSIYLEANDFGYMQASTAFYKMFGASYAGDGNGSSNVKTLTGQTDTLVDTASLEYTYGGSYPDQYVDIINPTSGELLFKSQQGFGRAVAYAGPNGTYRTVYSTFWLGALKDAPSTHTKADLMASYMRYLMGGDFVCGINDAVSAAARTEVTMLLEGGPSAAGRNYAVLGSMSGTSPGTPIGSVVLPLNYDAFMVLVVSLWNTPACMNFMGSLDAQGRSAATFDSLGPINPSFVGQTMHFAFLLTTPIDYASGAAGVPIDT